MDLSKRQREIITIVKRHHPITSNQIAGKLALSMPTIREDLRILTAFGLLKAKPKVGYSYSDAIVQDTAYKQMFMTKISSIIQEPTLVREDTTLDKAVNKLFIRDVGSLYVIDNENHLVGLISRKDLLRASLNNANAGTMLASTVMTRMPNLVTVTPDMTVLGAGELLLTRMVDSLPVVDADNPKSVIGKITKNRIFQHFIEIGSNHD